MEKNLFTCSGCDSVFEYSNKKIGLSGTYKRFYEPWQFIEGKKNSLIWVVGINQAFNEGRHDLDRLYPKEKGEWDKSRYQPDIREIKDLENAFKVFKDKNNLNTYYLNFKDISETVYSLMGLDYGVASTEVIRCGSVYNKPEAHLGKSLEEIVDLKKLQKKEANKVKRLWSEVPDIVRMNCRKHFKTLLESDDISVPKLIICNGKPVRKTLIELLLTEEDIKDILEETGQKKIEDVPVYKAKFMKQGKVNQIVVVQMDFVGRNISKLTKKTIGLIIDQLIEELQIIKLREKLLSL